MTELCLTGILEGREFVLKAKVDLGPVVSKEPFGDPAARDLFARAQLDYLARAHRLRLGLSDEAFFASLDRGNYSTSDELVSAQIDVSLETGVQSPYTSFIALLPEDRRRLDPRDVSALDQALLRVTERRRELAESARDPALASDETSAIDDPDGVEAEEVEKELVESLDDPIVTDLEVAEDRFQTRRDQPLSAAPFNGVGLNDVLGVGGGAGGRSGGKYGARGTGKVGGRASQKAVGWSLDWMPSHQGEDGSWSADQVRVRCASKHPDFEPCSDLGAGRHDVGVTAVSILSYLGSGNTVSTGKHKQVVRNGLKYLMGIQDPTCGRFGKALGQGASDGSLYDHAVATVAMTEGYGLSKWPILKGPAQRATDFLIAAIADDVAWSSTADPTTHLDLWTAAWATMALASARDFGLRVPDEVIEKLGARIADDAGAWSQTDPARGVSRGTARTAVALLYRVLLKQESASTDPFTEAAVAILMKQQPDRTGHPDAIDYHYECFASYALYQVGGDNWDTWQAAMLNAIVKAQNSEGPRKGTWEPSVDPWGDAGGRVYASAINALSLEVYYRYDRFVGAR